jgi:hypothetical protein
LSSQSQDISDSIYTREQCQRKSLSEERSHVTDQYLTFKSEDYTIDDFVSSMNDKSKCQQTQCSNGNSFAQKTQNHYIMPKCIPDSDKIIPQTNQSCKSSSITPCEDNYKQNTSLNCQNSHTNKVNFNQVLKSDRIFKPSEASLPSTVPHVMLSPSSNNVDSILNQWSSTCLRKDVHQHQHSAPIQTKTHQKQNLVHPYENEKLKSSCLNHISVPGSSQQVVTSRPGIIASDW